MDDMKEQFDFENTGEKKQETFDLMPFAEYLEKDNKVEKKKDTPISNNLLEIVEFKSNKSKIPQRQLMELNIIPRHPASIIMNGKSGSGKSTLLLNLCCMPQFYGPTQKTGSKQEINKSRYHDLIFIFSPTATQDDLPEYLNLDEKYIITENFEPRLEHIITTQRGIIEKKKIENSPKILIIFDDIQSQDSFMRSGSFLKCFIQNRHYNISTILCSQSFTRTPRACRLQASSIFFFSGSASEMELLVDEFCPSGMTKKQFMEMVKYTVKDKHSFMHINMKVPAEERYRKNLNNILKF
jgi:energy-coupling factor transporter ATP-binding protein EcfA2